MHAVENAAAKATPVMDPYKKLCQGLPPPNGNVFGLKKDGYAERVAEAKRLTTMLQTQRPFCFMRLGDVELKFLLTYQNDQLDGLHNSHYIDGPLNGTVECGNPGLGPKHAGRLWDAFAEAEYVDFHEKMYPNEYLLKDFKLVRKPGTNRNPGRESSVVFLTWVERQFKAYCQGRRIGIAGAESSILEALARTPVFQEAAREFWPEQAEIYFHQVRDDGKNLDANLDLVKEDLRGFITSNRLDTLFLSLGGGAKILGFELSRECGICCFDLGGAIRGLAYCGCDGNRTARSPHSPYLYRLPFETCMDALETAMPKLNPAERLAKAHGQLILELVRKEVGWSYYAYQYDFGGENRAAFQRAHRIYHEQYQHLFELNPETRREREGFLQFCATHNLTAEGRAHKRREWIQSCLAPDKDALRPLIGRHSKLRRSRSVISDGQAPFR